MDTIIDIGAHKGFFSLYASIRAKAGRVFSFEPHPDNYLFLQRNLKRNCAVNVNALNLAVWSGPSKAKLRNHGRDTGGHSLVLGTDTDDTLEVSCIDLREAFEMNNIHICEFLKIDAEGAEYELLPATPAGIFARIDKIVLEVHNVAGCSPGKLMEFLQKQGFETRFNGHLVFARKRGSKKVLS
jgi:FkbM family methyltransferase